MYPFLTFIRLNYKLFSMQKIYAVLTGIIISSALSAQLQLKSSIGVSSLPNDNDAICTPQCSTNYNFDTDGLKVGDTIPQFQFYTLNGTPMDAQTLLSSGKPLCIVAGSFTCPVWRGKITDLNTLVSSYGSQVNFLVVYVCEAHPKSPDTSPYSCNVWNPSQNQTEGVMYLQPTTYGARKATATDMMNNTCTCMPTINAPMVIDGPCNEFWKTFGPAPNNAYLINPTNGTVYCKHGWFNKAPNNMSTCISSLLSALAVKEPTVEPTISIYPNPATEASEFSIQGAEYNSASLEIKLFDVFGQEVMKKNLPPGTKSFKIETGSLGAGIYFYKLSNAALLMHTGKIILE